MSFDHESVGGAEQNVLVQQCAIHVSSNEISPMGSVKSLANHLMAGCDPKHRRRDPISPRRSVRDANIERIDHYGPRHQGQRGRIVRHGEQHRSGRIGWLRASVLGANDGIVSTASLIVGVAATGASRSAVIVAASAGLAAGAMAMAAGEYVSVSSQSDTEKADIVREAQELELHPSGERDELAQIYVERGVRTELAVQVADDLMAHDALGAHSRDELGISHTTTARPLQAAGSSAVSFTVGALLPLLVAAITPSTVRAWAVAAAALAFLAGLGVVAARVGGAQPLRPALRVTMWGAAAMIMTALIGKAVGTVV